MAYGPGYFVGAIAGCLWLFGMPIALFFSIKPSRSWALASNRGRNITVFILMFVLLPMVMIIGMQSDPAYRAKRLAEDKAKEAPEQSSVPPSMNMTTTNADTLITPQAATDTSAPASSGLDYLTLKAESEGRLKAVLKDDHGVRFRNVQTRLSTMDGGGIVAFCGEMNAKNGFGAYAGYTRFIASRSVATIEGQMSASDFEQAWDRFCTDGVIGPKVWF